MKIIALIGAIGLALTSISFTKPAAKLVDETIKDSDGNSYHTVRIGDQVWTVENLKVAHYNNGDALKTTTDDQAWSELNEGGWCYYRNLPADNRLYGKLYNWYALTDSRGLCPKGWHIATDEDWKNLIKTLGGDKKAGGPLKATDTWDQPNGGATNSSGFAAMPGGVRNSYGTYVSLNSIGYYWTASPAKTGSAWFIRMMCYDTKLVRDYVSKNTGFSVRLVKD